MLKTHPVRRRRVPAVSTEQIQAFVEFVHSGTLRQTAVNLHLSIEGVRARLLALQSRIGEPLYQSTRGRNDSLTLTAAGERVLALAPKFLDLACAMRSPGDGPTR